jgi:dTDP-4-amino-4,6-dideoxygalactose transaminase
MIPLVDLARQFQSIKKEILQQIEGVIDSGKYIIGDHVMQLEQRVAEKTSAAFAIGVGSGTDALILTLDAYGIGEGDEVITTPFTFFATSEAISRVGAKPVFVDIDSLTYNIDALRVEKAITPKTKAIMPVHLFGQPAQMDELIEVAKRHNLIIIEDACQAFGSAYKGKPVGSLGDAACFSFFPSKNLGTIGDGGMITTSNPEIAAKIRKLRHHGSSAKYYHDVLGYNSRLDELHAAILNIALEHIDEWNHVRRKLAARYRKELENLCYLRIPHEKDYNTHIYHLYCIESAEREAITAKLKQSGVQTGVYYPCPLHLQKAFAHLSYKKGDFPVAEKLSFQLFAIPMSPFLQEREQDFIISVLKSYGGELT